MKRMITIFTMICLSIVTIPFSMALAVGDGWPVLSAMIVIPAGYICINQAMIAPMFGALYSKKNWWKNNSVGLQLIASALGIILFVFHHLFP